LSDVESWLKKPNYDELTIFMYKVLISLREDLIESMYQYTESLIKEGFTFEEKKHWVRENAHKYEKQDIDYQFKEHRCFQLENLLYRVISPKPRNIHFASKFECPDNYKRGLNILIHKIIHGGDLFPHMSRNIINAKKKDGMLIDWGIHHLHMGESVDPEKPYLIEGKNLVLYCFVDELNVYALIIDRHGLWTQDHIFEILASEFPEAIEKFKMIGVMAGNTYSSKERAKLRKVGLTTFSTFKDNVYMPLGGGAVCSGDPLNAVTSLDKRIMYCQEYQKIIKNKFSPYMKENTSLVIDGAINFKLVLFNSDFCVVFDKQNKILLCISHKNIFPFNNSYFVKYVSTMKVIGVEENDIWKYINQSFFGARQY